MSHQKWFIYVILFSFLHELHDAFLNFFIGSFGHLVQMHLKGLAAKDGKKLCSSKDTFYPDFVWRGTASVTFPHEAL